MAIVTGDRYLESLVKFVENQADKLIEGTLVLKLNPVGLRYVQSRLEALAELESLLAGAPVDYLRAYVSDLGDHRALEQLRRILRLLPSLKVVSVVPPLRRDPTPLYLLPFGRLKVLELRGCDLSTSSAKGLLELRFTLEKLICHNSTGALRHVFASRIADIKDSPQWNRLSFVSCACNGLVLMDESLRLLPVVETLDLSRNKFAKVDNLRKCTKLKHVDLGFNNLRSIASFGEGKGFLLSIWSVQVSCQIVKLVLRNNALTSLHGIENLKSLQGLDLSYNVISNFSEIEILAGLPSLENLWLEGNPICFARWFRAQVFSLYSHPDQLKLDEKNISICDFWKRQIIVASRRKQPASFGFYIPLPDADVEEGINTKKKRISRLVSIENDKQSSFICSDLDSQSCDNEFQSKDEDANTDEAAEIEDLMNRIEYMKRDNSVLWLQEFKEWMNQTSENFVDGSKWNAVLYNNEDMRLKSDVKDEDLAETSRYVSDSFQLSGDESSTILLESGTSFADASTVASAQRYFDQIGEAASRFFMGHAAGERSVVKNYNVNQEEVRLLNNEGSVIGDARDSRYNSLAVPRGDNVSTKSVVSPSPSLNDNNWSHLSPACPGSPPHYQEDILHRRRNLEEEFLQLSAESFSVASTDSNTSCSEDDSAKFGPSATHVDQSVFDNSSETNRGGFLVAPYRFDAGDANHDNVLLLKQNGTHASSPWNEGNLVNTDGRELEISTLPCSASLPDALHDDAVLGFNMEKTDWLDKTKRRRKPRRRMISLPEEEDVHGDTDSSKKSSDHVETCKRKQHTVDQQTEVVHGSERLWQPCSCLKGISFYAEHLMVFGPFENAFSSYQFLVDSCMPLLMSPRWSTEIVDFILLLLHNREEVFQVGWNPKNETILASYCLGRKLMIWDLSSLFYNVVMYGYVHDKRIYFALVAQLKKRCDQKNKELGPKKRKGELEVVLRI
ncbi:serine/threonine-protein kinase 11-interacting protein [Phtheirospermum japonicum]|uniref:Serine/threonine-protein kinase 11-interacting protein n=1 Tax=Phtheirospermum japonicum TaxID=374723 RepID=A0A830BK10_9LAMI|nr:serine/threonine-protein kinase 11-interacting protein [Phtheirospermum japonicum]